MAVLGPSGCGKSTLLQMAAGLLPVSEGTVRIAGRRITAPPPEAVYVFQQYTRSLLPWRNVRDNVAFALEHRLGHEPTWRAGLGDEAEAGPFLGMDEWTRISEVWPAPDPDDPEMPMEIAARLADYIDAIEPPRRTRT